MKLVILMGLPGSGKSTLCETEYKGYTRINQDALGSRDKCMLDAHKALQSEEDVVVDRCNINEAQRCYWIKLGLKYDADEIICHWVQTPIEECLKRIQNREGHPTIPKETSLDKIEQIVYSFNKSLEQPRLSEGLTRIIIS